MATYGDKGEYGKAIADYDQALAIDPTYFFAYNNRDKCRKKIADAGADHNQHPKNMTKSLPPSANP